MRSGAGLGCALSLGCAYRVLVNLPLPATYYVQKNVLYCEDENIASSKRICCRTEKSMEKPSPSTLRRAAAARAGLSLHNYLVCHGTTSR